MLASLGQRANGLVFRYGNIAGVTTVSKRDVETPESQSTPAASRQRSPTLPASVVGNVGSPFTLSELDVKL